MVVLTRHTVEGITSQLVDALNPDRIYLFGSRAYGIPGPGSDIDLVIIVPDSTVETRGLDVRAREIIGDIGCAVDVMLYTAGVFDRRSGWRANFEYTVRNKGILLYGVDGMSFAREWLDKAMKDRAAAERLIRETPPLNDAGAFHCQQAAEKALKAFLVHRNEPFEKLHDLRLLCDLAAKFDERFKNLRDEAAALNRYAVQSRYPGRPDPTPAEAEAALAILARIWDVVMTSLPDEIRLPAPAAGKEIGKP
jgi:HEPN domain-containing protein